MSRTVARPVRLAHRGDWRRAPENSLPAMLAALRIPGCDGLEFDVRSAADGVPVLLHDETLERVQGRPDRADALSAAELGRHGVPTLAAVLESVPRDAFLDIEVKGVPGAGTVEVIEAKRGVGRGLRRAVVSAFEPEALEAVASARPGWPRWLNVEDLEPTTIATARDLGCTGVSADWHAIDRASARRVAAVGLDLAAWTVRRTATYRRLAALGVVAICAEAAALDRGGGD